MEKLDRFYVLQGTRRGHYPLTVGGTVREAEVAAFACVPLHDRMGVSSVATDKYGSTEVGQSLNSAVRRLKEY